MSDYYTEQLVKRKAAAKDIFIKALMCALTIVSILVVFWFPFGIIVPVVLIVLDVLLFRRLDVEYEYLYVNGDLDIDKIMHKERRKRMYSMNINDMEILARSGCAELNAYRSAKTFDFSTGNPGAKTYDMIVVSQGQKQRIIFEPNETIVEGIWMMAPRKVIK